MGTFFAMMVDDDAAADTSAQTVIAVAAEANLAWPARLGRFLGRVGDCATG